MCDNFTMKHAFLIFLCLLLGCQEASQDVLRAEGRAKAKNLIAELKKVRTKDQLVEREQVLRVKFEAYRELLERAESYVRAHPDSAPPPLEQEDHELSDSLRLELMRIMRLEGGREIVESF